jgi:sugar (glycoside-pentoside-hexuronide) transporter
MSDAIPLVLGKKEKRSYYTGALGQGMMYAMMSSYISDFYINVLLNDPASTPQQRKIIPIFVFLLMLLARAWDAICDPLVGTIVDRSNPKKGKMRAYLFYIPIPVAVFTFLLFVAPSMPINTKMVYAVVTYVLWGMLYAVGDIPFWSLPNAMTANTKERDDLISKSRTTNGIGSAVPIAIFTVLGFILPAISGRQGVELEKLKYLITAIIPCAVGGLLYFRTPFAVQERVPLPPKTKETEKGALKAVLTCKPLMLVAATSILASGRYMLQAATLHVARYSLSIKQSFAGLVGEAQEKALQSNLSTVSMVFQVVIAVGMFGAMLLTPMLIKKYNGKQLIIGTSLLGGVSGLVMYFIGYAHFWAILPFLFLCSVPLGVINVVTYNMIPDALDYMEAKTGRRENGLGLSTQTFVLKLGNALATSSIMLAYSILGFNPADAASKGGTVNPLDQAPSVRKGMFSLVSLIPAISLFLCIIPMIFYDLTGDKKREVSETLAARRAAVSNAAAEE